KDDRRLRRVVELVNDLLLSHATCEKLRSPQLRALGLGLGLSVLSEELFQCVGGVGERSSMSCGLSA
ncbi:unnamed protein product, partial [Discosporangium mesarthrocarpum]